MDGEKDITAAGFSVNKCVLSAIGHWPWPYQNKMERSFKRIIDNGIMVVEKFSSVRKRHCYIYFKYFY